MVERLDRPRDRAAQTGSLSMLGPIHAFGSGCFFVFGIIYLVFIDSAYLFASNFGFGALCVANWYLLPRTIGEGLHASVFLAIVYLGLVNVAVHLGLEPLPMVFWGMSISIAAAFLMGRGGVVAWVGISVLFYPIVALLKTGPLAERVISLTLFQTELLAVATYVGLLCFLTYSFLLFRNRLDRAIAGMTLHANALERSESMLAESQRVARIGHYECDLVRGAWTSSPLLDEIFDIDETYVRDLPGWLALVHPDDREWLEQQTRDYIACDGAILDREYRLAREDAEGTVWVHSRAVVSFGADGRPERLVGTVQDISGLKRNEEERRQLEARLYHAQKLESLGVLAGGIAHDFNNLLTGIQGNVVLAREAQGNGPVATDRLLRQAEAATSRAADLTRQMLAFAGKGRLIVEPLDVNAEIEEMVRLLTSSVSKLVELRLELAPEALWILADASHFQQVIMNVLLNAAEAIGDQRGVITVRTSQRLVEVPELAGAFVSDDFVSGEQVCVEVEDSGCGMDAETRERLFEPFFTTKFTGRGLGLAAVLGIVRGHKGAIVLDSAPGEGTTFTLLLACAPADAAANARARGPAPVAAPAAPSTACVLLVDDEAIVREVGRHMLERSGFRVLEADDGRSGVDLFQQRGNEIDLVLLDLTMPKMGGVETFHELKRLRPDLPIVLMSGHSRNEVLEFFPDAVPEDFVAKPFRPDALLAATNSALSR